MRRHDLTYAQPAYQTGERGRSATPVRTRVGLWCHREPPRARLCEETGASMLADFVQSGTIKADACPCFSASTSESASPEISADATQEGRRTALTTWIPKLRRLIPSGIFGSTKTFVRVPWPSGRVRSRSRARKLDVRNDGFV